jgi:hypothetical protein
MAKETRIAPRRRTNKAGIIKTAEKELTVVLRDVSKTGARVKLVSPGSIPDRFKLVAALEKINADCVVVWRRGKDCGVRFEPRGHR